MLPSYCVFLALTLNVIAALILKPWIQFPLCAKYLRLMRTVNAYRYAGLLILVLSASFAHAQYEVFEDRARCPGCIGVSGVTGTKHEIGKMSSEIARRYEEAKKHIMLDIPQNTNPNQWMWQSESCSPAEQQHMRCINTAIYLGNDKYGVTWFDAMQFWFSRKVGDLGGQLQDGSKVISPTSYSDGDTAIAKHMVDQYEDYTGYPWLDKTLHGIWNNLGKLLILAVVMFLMVQFGGGARESNDTDIEGMLDPDYRTGFVNDYHGDKAFEVPDGMESAHRSVPVRKVRA